MVYLKIPLGRDWYSYGDQSIGKEWKSIDCFLYGAPYSMQWFLIPLPESIVNNLCVNICNSSNTL